MKSNKCIALENKVSALISQCEEQIATLTKQAENESRQNELYAAAEMTYTLYEAYMAAGFDEEQAWELVKINMTNAKNH